MSTDPYGITISNAPALNHAVPTCNNAPKPDSAQKKAHLYVGLASTRNLMIAPHYALTVCDLKTPLGQVMLTTAAANDRHMLPRVHICDDGTYCCDNSPNCCNNGTGVLLTPNGKLISNTISSTVVTSTSPSIRAASKTAASALTKSSIASTAYAASTTLATPAGASNRGASALPSGVSEVTTKKSTTNVKGIVIGVVVTLVVVAAGAGLWIWRQRRRIRKLKANFDAGQSAGGKKGSPFVYSELYAPVGPEQNWAKPFQQNEVAELRGVGVHGRPVELPTSLERNPPPSTFPS